MFNILKYFAILERMKPIHVLLILQVSTFAFGELVQSFIREPDNQTAIEGEQVTLPCRVDNKFGILQWTRDGFGLGASRELPEYNRYHLIGSDEEKDWTLKISPILLEDDAMFQCQVGAADGVRPIRSKFAKLTVYVPPGDPFIVQGHMMEATEDREVRLECVSPGGKPAADIDWHDGDNNVIVKDVSMSTRKLDDGKRFNTTSVIRFVPKKHHHNKNFTCSASNIADRNRRSVSIKMVVRYAPSVRLTTNNNHGPVREGDTITFRCHAHANPRPTQYSWYVNGQMASGHYGDYFAIANISRAYHNSIVKCEVHNEIGKSEETETIQVRYGPRIRSHPRTTAAELGDTVSLHCDVDSNPAPKYTWTRQNSRQVVGSSQNLTVTSLSERNEGEYWCHAITDGFDLVTALPAKIMLMRPPVITSSQIQYGKEGENIDLKCEAESVPRAIGMVWTFLGQPIDPIGSLHYEILNDNSDANDFKSLSTLIIRKSERSDFGQYGCVVTNRMGEDQQYIMLEQKETFPILIVLIGLFSTIIILLLLTLIIVLFRKKTCTSQTGSNSSEKPMKPNNLDSLSQPDSELKVEGQTGSSLSNGEVESWEGSETQDALYRQGLIQDYPDPDFPPKPDVISTGYVPYGSYVRDYNPPFPNSDSQSSLQSASQLTSNRQSALLNVSDPRYSATYGNPYLRSAPKHTQYSSFSPAGSPNVVYVPNNLTGHPISYVPSIASTTTVNSVLSNPDSGLGSPPVPGGSIMGIRPISPPTHHRHPVSNDLYAIVSKPGSSTFNNVLSKPSPPAYRSAPTSNVNNMNNVSNTSMASPGTISTLPERNSLSSGNSPGAQYILANSQPTSGANDIGTHV